MSRDVLLLRTTGFAKLREGRIHNRCYSCGRKISNQRRMDYDPTIAFLCESECPRCGNRSGSKDAEWYYFDSDGNQLAWCEKCSGEGCTNCDHGYTATTPPGDRSE